MVRIYAFCEKVFLCITSSSIVFHASYITESNIQSKILADYNTNTRPVLKNEPVVVFFQLKLQRIVEYVSYFCKLGKRLSLRV